MGCAINTAKLFSSFGVGLASVLSIALSGTVNSAEAVPVTINDHYIGAQPTSAGWIGADIIGNISTFDIHSMTVEVVNQHLSLSIKSSYFDNVGLGGTTFGDVFVSSNGWSPFGTAPYTEDSASNGESWEYALVFNNHGENLANSQAGSMIGASGTVSLMAITDPAQIQLSRANGDFRRNQEVDFVNTNGANALSQGSWSIVAGESGYSYLNLSISFGEVQALALANKLGFHFGFSCGNDVIEGEYSRSTGEVPEPASMILLLSGLTGLVKRRKNSN